MKIILTITISFVYLCGYGQIKDTCKHNIVCYLTEPPQYECEKCHKKFSFYRYDYGIDTIDVNPVDTDGIYGRLPLGTKIEIDTSQYLRYEPEKYDTIPVIMLVCDTAYTNMVGWYLDNKYEYWDYRWEIKWWFGYDVREFAGYINGNTGTYAVYIATPSYRHLLYLDDKKKPLPASIIVWQTINRK